MQQEYFSIVHAFENDGIRVVTSELSQFIGVSPGNMFVNTVEMLFAIDSVE